MTGADSARTRPPRQTRLAQPPRQRPDRGRCRTWAVSQPFGVFTWAATTSPPAPSRAGWATWPPPGTTIALGDQPHRGRSALRWGGLAELRTLELQNNALTGETPSALTNLRQLDRFDASGNAVCVPSGDAFRAWREANRGAGEGHSGLPHARTTRVTGRCWRAFYDATGGPNWTDDTNWKSDEPLYTWLGGDHRRRRPGRGAVVAGQRTDGADSSGPRGFGEPQGFCGSTATSSAALSQPVWGAWPISRNCRYGTAPTTFGTAKTRGLTGAIPPELGWPAQPHEAESQGTRPKRPDPSGHGQPDQPPESESRRKQSDRGDAD